MPGVEDLFTPAERLAVLVLCERDRAFRTARRGLLEALSMVPLERNAAAFRYAPEPWPTWYPARDGACVDAGPPALFRRHWIVEMDLFVDCPIWAWPLVRLGMWIVARRRRP